MGRVENIAIFEDTRKTYQTDPELVAAIRASSHVQEVILESDEVMAVPPRFAEPVEIIVSQKRSFEAARDYPIYPTCVLNFASATNPGGGVVWCGALLLRKSVCVAAQHCMRI